MTKIKENIQQVAMVDLKQSQWSRIWQQFTRNRTAVLCLWVLLGLYIMAIFAGFLAPYSYKTEDSIFSYAPPSKVHVIHDGKLMRPFIYNVELSYDEYRARHYIENIDIPYPIQFFVKGDAYKLLGFFPTDRHLFGVDRSVKLMLMGSDGRGRDLLSRIIHGARISLSIGLIGVAISFSIGLIIGGISGYFGGRVDQILMRLCEMVMMVPGFYLLLALRAAVPDNFNSVQVYLAIVVILSFIGWASLARIIRGMTLSLRERDYVLAAKTMGISDFRIIMTHILPHTVSYSIAAVMLSIPGYILGESALSLIGLGIQDPYASWGNLLTDAMSIVRIYFAPWILWPAFFIFVTVICFNIIGDALRDALDPLLKKSGVRS